MSSTRLSDDRIWSPSELREFLDHDDPTIRNWALRRSARELDSDESTTLAAELLDDQDRHVATRALRIIQDGSSELLVDHADDLRDFSTRDAIGRPVRKRCLGLLAAIGDEEARTTMLGEAGEQTFEWSEWAKRNPEGLVEAALEHFGDPGLPGDPSLVEALILTGVPEVASHVFETLARHADSFDLETEVQLIIATGGGGLWELPDTDDMGWTPPEETSPAFRRSYELLEPERDRKRTELQCEARRDGDWQTLAAQSLETLEALDAMDGAAQ